MNYRTSIGLDVHARSIKAAAFVPETGEIIEKSFAYSPLEITEWALTLPGPVRAVYESGPTGFDLARKLMASGIDCEVGAVTKMLRPTGDRIKTDKRDAIFLARMLAVGNIVSVHIPVPEEEAARDVVRAREDAREELTRAKLLLRTFLLRKGIVYDGATGTKKYERWLDTLTFELADEHFAFDEYLAGIACANQKKLRLDEQIKMRAAQEPYVDRVLRIQCLRGIGTLVAFALVVEIGDFTRFTNARAFMSYLGLVPSESSSGESVSRGGITKTGNTHIRKLLTEAAWLQGRWYSPNSVEVVKNLSSVPAPIAAIAEKANKRLHKRYLHLKGRNKPTCLVNSAVARELAGWIWTLETATI